MQKRPELLPGREIRRMHAALLEEQEDILREVASIDAAIREFPPGAEKRALQAAQNELKAQLGLLPDEGIRRSAREGWSSEKLLAKTIELKDAARKWSAAGQAKRAELCLKDARSLEAFANSRRSRDR